MRRFSENISAVAAQAQTRTRIAYREVSLDRVSVRECHAITCSSRPSMRSTDASIGRDRNRPEPPVGRPARLTQTAERLFGPVDALDKII